MSSSTASELRSATAAFDALFANRIAPAKRAFAAADSPFHLLGQGVCAFLEAALGMEQARMAEASRCLALAEAGAKRRRGDGVEWEVLHADAVVLLGLTNALSAHSKFNKLFKTVFPGGIDAPPAPLSPPLLPNASAASSTSSFFKWGSSRAASPLPSPVKEEKLDPAVADLIVSGTAFGHGLFGLVLSLLPSKARTLVGAFGFKADRGAALKALVKAAEAVDGAQDANGGALQGRGDVHGVFAALVLMTYWGAVLLLGGWCADEANIVREYAALVERVANRYPTGALWILNRAKILRMTHDAAGAVRVLEGGLAADGVAEKVQGAEAPAPGVDEVAFREADTLLIFELAWTQLAQRRYAAAGALFVRITELNSWSHGTYYFLAAGCFWSAGPDERGRAQGLLDAIPALLEKRKGPGGKELPTEVYIKRKLAFYKAQQKARGGDEAKYVEAIRISPAEEMAIFWNTHARIDESIARAHIAELGALSPAPAVASPYLPAPAASSDTPDLTTPDELAIRALLLGITHRALGAPAYPAARAFLDDAVRTAGKIGAGGATWVGGVACFETAVLELRAADAAAEKGKEGGKEMWAGALARAGALLDRVNGGDADLSSRLESRVGMLREEIRMKKEGLGIAA
ncbi:hypothetical protein HWV62_26454 [Athelia sp. TMB]|nr:hypothetical protein HWV62_26454 [Athelia sp. TMB]